MLNNDPELLAEQAEDAKFLVELNNLVNTFESPSAEDIAIYNSKLTYLEEIHNEVKKKYPEFQPEYNPLEESDPKFPSGKYCDQTYKVASFNSGEDE